MIDVILCRGTGEPYIGQMLDNVRLDPRRFQFCDLAYPAQVGPAPHPLGVSEDQSVTDGVNALAAQIRRTPNKVGLLGYSLGALVVSRFLEDMAVGRFPDLEVSFAGLVANPLRPDGVSVDNLCRTGTFGVAGQRGPAPASVTVWEIANPDDGITSCPADSPLRTVADGMSAFSFADLGGWSMDLVERIARGNWQATIQGEDAVQVGEAYAEAVRLVIGYLTPAPNGQHTLYGTATMPGQAAGVTYCDRLAGLINGGQW